MEELSGTYYFMHMEIGYAVPGKFRDESRVLPKPEYSGPNNTRALDEVYRKIKLGVVEQAVREVLDIMNENGKRGMFLAFPYFAEKYSGILKEILNKGHVVGIHMHENWKALASRMSLEQLTNYINSEKARLEKAIENKIIIFSYGPGVELDDIVRPPDHPPSFPSLNDEEKRRFFQAVANAGFKYIQTALEYQRFVPSTLAILDNFRRSRIVIIGLPHTCELVSRDEVVWRQNPNIRNLIEQLYR